MTEPQRLGKYRLLRRIAVGGVAEVYLAVAEGAGGFEKRVVVKRLQPARGRDPAVVAMFLDEARLMALFHHPHVAEVYDIGAEGDERFFAMEYVDGCDLRDLLDAAPGEALPLPAALAIVRSVAEGLAHAHEQKDRAGVPLGVVHRDVSPSNVLLGRRGEVKLIDFGVAKWSAQRSHTEHGTLKGKFAYMSPEQCRAEPLDGRSDLFALGVLLYELCTGQRPFAAESEFELLSAIVRGTFVAPALRAPQLPAALAAVIERALAPSPDERHPGAAAFVEALNAAAVAAGIAPDAAAICALLEARLLRRPPTPIEADLPQPGSGRAARSGQDRRQDRTATDWSTPPPALAAAAPVRRAVTRARMVMAAVVLAAVGVLGVGLLRARPDAVPVAGPVMERPLPAPAAAIPAAPEPVPPPGAAPDSAVANAPLPTVSPAPAATPVAAPASPPALRAAVMPVSTAPRRSKRRPDAPPAPAAASEGQPAAASPPPAPKVVWDPDSPTPP